MITTVATFSLAQARAYLAHRPERHPFARQRVAWVGFDDERDASPLREESITPSLVVRCDDWDPDCPTRGHHGTGPNAPTIEHARAIVAFVLALNADPEPYALAVHCYAGLFRSGAVAEWARVDLAAREDGCSNRLVDVLTGEPWKGDRAFNVTLLRLLREAHAEALR